MVEVVRCCTAQRGNEISKQGGFGAAQPRKETSSRNDPKNTWVCLKMGYTPNEIAIFHRDNDH